MVCMGGHADDVTYGQPGSAAGVSFAGAGLQVCEFDGDHDGGGQPGTAPSLVDYLCLGGLQVTLPTTT